MPDSVSNLIRITNEIGRGSIPPFQHTECFTAGAFDLLLVDVHGEAAFDLLIQLCQRFPEVQATPSARSAYFGLLGKIARQSGTTEIPPALLGILALHPEFGSGLRAWYRLDA